MMTKTILFLQVNSLPSFKRLNMPSIFETLPPITAGAFSTATIM